MTADYSNLIDAETWAFIRRTKSFYPADTITFTIARQRGGLCAMYAAFIRAIPPGWKWLTQTSAGCPAGFRRGR